MNWIETWDQICTLAEEKVPQATLNKQAILITDKQGRGLHLFCVEHLLEELSIEESHLFAVKSNTPLIMKVEGERIPPGTIALITPNLLSQIDEIKNEIIDTIGANETVVQLIIISLIFPEPEIRGPLQAIARAHLFALDLEQPNSIRTMLSRGDNISKIIRALQKSLDKIQPQKIIGPDEIIQPQKTPDEINDALIAEVFPGIVEIFEGPAEELLNKDLSRFSGYPSKNTDTTYQELLSKEYENTYRQVWKGKQSSETNDTCLLEKLSWEVLNLVFNSLTNPCVVIPYTSMLRRMIDNELKNMQEPTIEDSPLKTTEEQPRCPLAVNVITSSELEDLTSQSKPATDIICITDPTQASISKMVHQQ